MNECAEWVIKGKKSCGLFKPSVNLVASGVNSFTKPLKTWS